MRLSSQTIFDNSVTQMLARQQDVSRTQEHISTGRRVVRPSDDPTAAAQMLDVSEAKARNAQFTANASTVKARLAIEESTLSTVTRAVQDLKTLTVQAGNAALSPSDLHSIATEVEARYGELLGLANATDGSGEHLFAGFSARTPPFAETAPGVVVYLGDEGRQEVAISDSRTIALNDPGTDVFMRIRNGNGTFAPSAAGGNTGTGIVSPGSVTDATQVTNHAYSIAFSVGPGGTTYTVTDTTTATVLANAVPYVAGAPIGFDGLQVEIDGAPADGDSFAIAPSTNTSVFTTIQDLLVALRNSRPGADGAAQLTNALNVAHANLDNSLDQVLSVSAAVGTRIREIDAVTSANEDLGLQYETRLSELRDLDYTRAISELAFQQIQLEAAQKSYARVSQLSLFNFI